MVVFRKIHSVFHFILLSPFKKHQLLLPCSFMKGSKMLKGSRICYLKVCLFDTKIILSWLCWETVDTKKLWEWSRSKPFLSVIYFRKGAWPRKRALSKDNFTWEIYLFFGATFVHQTFHFLFSTSSNLPSSPLQPWSPSPIPFLSPGWSITLNLQATLSGAPKNLIKIFSLLIVWCLWAYW